MWYAYISFHFKGDEKRIRSEEVMGGHLGEAGEGRQER